MKHDMVSEVRGGAILRRQNLCESNGKEEAHGLPNYLQLMIILPLAGDSGRKFGSYEIDGIYKQNDLVCVSNLLSVIRQDAVKIFDKFTWRDGEKDCKIAMSSQNLTSIANRVPKFFIRDICCGWVPSFLVSLPLR